MHAAGGNRIDLSIVIPAYEESAKIQRDVAMAAAFLSGGDLCGEVIVVDDGSKDDTYEAAQREASQTAVPTQVIRLDRNRGKGAAVRAGVERSRGEYVMFADSGCCIPYEMALVGIDLIRTGQCDIAHGSRKTHGCQIRRHQTWVRRLCSKAFRLAVDRILRVPGHLTDTQCGFKVYRGDVAREIYPLCRTDGFVFDIEIILLAQQRGYRIVEFPVTWTCDSDSRISVSRTSRRVLREIFNIRRNMKDAEKAHQAAKELARSERSAASAE